MLFPVARVAELVDAPDLGSGVLATWGFKSLLGHVSAPAYGRGFSFPRSLVTGSPPNHVACVGRSCYGWGSYVERVVFKPEDEAPVDGYKLAMSLVVPRPIAWVATFNEDGSANLAPYALFSVVCTDPLMFQFTSRAPKDSYRNAKREGAFTVHIASVDHKPQVAMTSKELPAGVSEADAVGMTWKKAPNVNAPMLDDARVAVECEVHSFVEVETAILTVGKVKAIHTDSQIMAEDGMVAFAKLNPLSKLGRAQWGRTEDFV